MTLSKALRNVAFLGSSVPKFDFVFTIGDQEDVPGRLGRTRAQHLDSYAAHNSPYDVIHNPWLTDLNKYDVIDGIQYFLVPFSGFYTVLASGAQRNTRDHSTDPLFNRDTAGMVRAKFFLEKDEVLLILCGRNGHFLGSDVNFTRYDALGGNGGTFVAIGSTPSESSPLAVAGGSARLNYWRNNVSTLKNDAEMLNIFGSPVQITGATVGVDGGESAGFGLGGESRSAAGGAGFYGDSRSYSGNRGGLPYTISEDRKARAFVSGGAGGIGFSDPDIGYGGFGGGGGTTNFSSSFEKPAGGAGGFHGGGGTYGRTGVSSDSARSGRGTSFLSGSAISGSITNANGGTPALNDFPQISSFSTSDGLTRSGRVWIRYSPVI